MYVYKQTEPYLFTVGFYAPDGTWHPDSDRDSKDEAAERVHYLNGGVEQFQPVIGEIAHSPRSSVKIMRSYDYCHFEIALGCDVNMTIDQMNDLRKQAALLVDEAVRQYKKAKAAEDLRDQLERRVDRFLERVNEIQQKPESDWSPEEAAIMRSYADGEFWREVEEADYWYDEDSHRDHHFSMLRKFQNSRISAG